MQHGADRIDRALKSARYFSVGGLKVHGSRPHVIQLRGEFGAVAAERLELRLQGVALAILFVASIDRSLERVDG
jgi:hypothetical protein